jgi:hypothetical protein
MRHTAHTAGPKGRNMCGPGGERYLLHANDVSLTLHCVTTQLHPLHYAAIIVPFLSLWVHNTISPAEYCTYSAL